MSKTDTAPSESATHTRLPAEAPFWGFVFADMTVFAGFFIAYLWEFGSDRSGFAREAAHVSVWPGLINTLILLASSYAVVLAVRAQRAGSDPSTLIAWALGGAAGFAGIKITEYSVEIAGDHTLTSSTFFTYYFVLTGLHLMHVAIGSVLLMTWRHGQRTGRKQSIRFAECCAGYWHMVDLLWLVIFSLVYIGSHT